jgi:hypothetical protein
MVKTGRPKKPEGERMVNRVMRWPRALWGELEALVPPQQRSAFVRSAVEQALKRLRRHKEQDQ